MDSSFIETCLIEVVGNIARKCGEVVTIGRDSRPAKDLESFDSVLWPVAIALLGEKLGVALPPTLDLFGDSKGALSIAQSASKLSTILGARQQKDEVVA